MEQAKTISIMEYLKNNGCLDMESEDILMGNTPYNSYHEKRWECIRNYFREVRQGKIMAHGDSILFEWAFLGNKDSKVTKSSIQILKQKKLLEECYER